MPAQYVALYCRESKDRRGKGENVADQERWGREYAAGKWPGLPVRVFTDNHAPADEPRPEYDRLRECIRLGEVAGVWVSEQSRVERDEIGWFTVAAELDAAGLTELHTRRDGVLPVRGLFSGIKAVVDAEEKRRLRVRVNDRLGEIAAAGRPPGSQPFGYARGVTAGGEPTYVVVPEQAQAIRDAARLVLDGWAVTRIAALMRERGLHSAHRKRRVKVGGQFTGPPREEYCTITGQSVSGWLTNATVAGYRVHRGVIVGRGNWEPILDETSWQACRARLGGTRTVTGRDGAAHRVNPQRRTTGRKYLLTGGLAVSVHGEPMKGTVKQISGGAKRGGADVPYLTCKGAPGRKGVTIRLDPVEEYVRDQLFAEIDKPGFVDEIALDDNAERRAEITDALVAIDGQRADLADMWGAGELSRDEWTRARARLDDREVALRDELAEKAPPPARATIENARESWPDMTLDERREMLRLFIARVVILPAIRRGGDAPEFDPDRVQIEFGRG